LQFKAAVRHVRVTDSTWLQVFVVFVVTAELSRGAADPVVAAGRIEFVDDQGVPDRVQQPQLLPVHPVVVRVLVRECELPFAVGEFRIMVLVAVQYLIQPQLRPAQPVPAVIVHPVNQVSPEVQDLLGGRQFMPGHPGGHRQGGIGHVVPLSRTYPWYTTGSGDASNTLARLLSLPGWCCYDHGSRGPRTPGGKMGKENWVELVGHWVNQDTEGVIASIARMSREDAEELIAGLLMLTCLVTEAKEIL